MVTAWIRQRTRTNCPKREAGDSDITEQNNHLICCSKSQRDKHSPETHYTAKIASAHLPRIRTSSNAPFPHSASGLVTVFCPRNDESLTTSSRPCDLTMQHVTSRPVSVALKRIRKVVDSKHPHVRTCNHATSETCASSDTSNRRSDRPTGR
jgi:hypothetical protein